MNKNHHLSAKILIGMLGLVVGLPTTGFSQTTSYSDIVGYYSTVIKGASAGSSSSFFSFVPVQVAKSPSFSGVGTATGNTVNLTGGSLGDVVTSPHYLIIKSGTGVGYVSDITAATSSSVTLADDLSGHITAGTQVAVVPHLLLTDILGTGASLAIGSGANPNTADVAYLVGADGSFKSYYYKSGLGAGWKDISTGLAANIVPVYPSESILVERRASADTAAIVLSGTVANHDMKSVYAPGFTSASSSYPTNLTLGDLTAILTGGVNANVADRVYLVDSSTGQLKGFYYKTGLGAGWKDVNTGGPADTTLNIGNGFVVERKQSTSTVLSQIKPF